MSTKKQERARARRRYEKQQAVATRRADEASRWRIMAMIIGVVVVGAVLLAMAGATLSRTEPLPAKALAGCEPPPASLGTGATLELPSADTAAGKTFTATVTTNCGDIELLLDGVLAPQAVASFIQLARTDYWLNAPCHRLLTAPTATLLQCGDPTGTGQGSPGYGFAVENPGVDGAYPRGTLAMARTSDPQTGNGGQFFLVAQDTTLPDPDGYTVFGRVIQGLDIVDKIVAAGVSGGQDATDGAPKAPLSILRVAVTEKKA